MNLPRLRELAKAGKDGSIRPEELKELFEALPEVLDAIPNHCTWQHRTNDCDGVAYCREHNPGGRLD